MNKKALALIMMGTAILGIGSAVSADDMKVHVTYMDIDLWDELKQVDVTVDEKIFTKLCDYTIDFDPALFKAGEVKGYHFDPDESYYYTDEDGASLEVYLVPGDSAGSDDADDGDDTGSDADGGDDNGADDEIAMEGDIPDYIDEVVNARKSMEYTLMDDVDGISLSIPEDIQYHETSETWILPFEATNDSDKAVVVNINDVCVNGMSISTGQLLFMEPGETVEEEMLITQYDLDCVGVEDIRYMYFSYSVEDDEDLSEIMGLTWSPLFLRGDEIVKDELPYGDLIYEDENIALFIMPEAYSTNDGEMVHFQYLVENYTDEFIGFYGTDPVLINGEEPEEFQYYMSFTIAPQMAGYRDVVLDVTTLGLTHADEIDEIAYPIQIRTMDSDKIDIQTESYCFSPIMENR